MVSGALSAGWGYTGGDHLEGYVLQSIDLRSPNPCKHIQEGENPNLGHGDISPEWVLLFLTSLCTCISAPWHPKRGSGFDMVSWASLFSLTLWAGKALLYSHSKLCPLVNLPLGGRVEIGSGNEPRKTVDSQDS